MTMTGRRALLALPAALPGHASAQDLPTRPLTWVVPFPPGNIADAASRLVAQRLGQVLGRRVDVENRPGVGGTIGTEAVARAAPDGHTLLYGGLGPIAAAPHLVPSLRFDPARDLAPVHGIGASPCMIVIGPRRPWTTLAELAAAARARPEGLVYASPGIGTVPHLAAEVFQQVAEVRLVHAPYVNTAEILSDVIGGRVDVTWDFPLTAAPHVREGRLRALAVTDFDRVRVASEVPTLMECGFPGAEMRGWAGVFAPARTPSATVARLAAALRETLLDQTVKAFFDGTGTVLWPDVGTERFRAFLAEELPRVATLIARAKASPR
ncbi:tripartite tricarboxylate transporter substrate binding protein [Siccirubricoccus sp. G192]|uniref:Bug family tripartite tricarboxylate transporter substrate binding protein n=1 Tax=Siccirubricoccus sp. G192 TaxID=2849651 RepID=UPI001C2C501E|nr:tripartite tricarboxylate transporter substrate binding protein [Siccirubricoccus sp. G192]MBV1798917.1 tripartite tricarboxylate transporter substrate binding protein [Siccirubricoccus sp. G192]